MEAAKRTTIEQSPLNSPDIQAEKVGAPALIDLVGGEGGGGEHSESGDNSEERKSETTTTTTANKSMVIQIEWL